ncbi:MAG: ribonuclease HI family protein [Chloroflexota bacterium]
MYTLRFDGMFQTFDDKWPVGIGLLGYGWVITRNDVEVAHGYGIFARRCDAGSNVAEYLALIEGLEALADLQIKNHAVEVRGDAKCVIDQMLGQATVSTPLTLTLHRRAQKLARRYKHLTWTWVPRRENKHADKLSRRSRQHLHYSPHLEQEIQNAQIIPLYGGRLIPLLDLRVHAPRTQAHLTSCLSDPLLSQRDR